MAAQRMRKGGGGKLARSETVTVRLDPKLRYLAELAARKQRRTLSSYIEWAIEDNLKSVSIHVGTGYQGDDNISVAEEAQRLWDVDDAERSLRLAIHYPDLLTHQEQEVWKLVQDSLLLTPAQGRRNGNVVWDMAKLEVVVFPAVRRRWADLMLAYETGSISARSEWVERTRTEVLDGRAFPTERTPYGRPPTVMPPVITGFDDMDDEIPF